MDNLKLTAIILACLLAVACAYIFSEKVDLCETTKNDSYNAGFNQGAEQWNAQVIYNVNNKGAIPYWFNQTRYELTIEQLCGVQNG